MTTGLRDRAAHSPYGLDMIESCVECPQRHSGYFCDMHFQALQDFDVIKSPISYPEHAILFMEGQPSRGVFMLCKGRVKLSITSREGKSLILRIAEPGEILGLTATVSGKPYAVTAETMHPAQVNFIKRDDFLHFLFSHGEASMHAAEHLSSNCQQAYNQIRSIGLSHSAPEKLARLLLDWSNDGERTKAGLKVKLALTHEEIAQIIGTSRETVTRLLGNLRERKVATLKGSTLTIHNRVALEELVRS